MYHIHMYIPELFFVHYRLPFVGLVHIHALVVSLPPLLALLHTPLNGTLEIDEALWNSLHEEGFGVILLHLWFIHHWKDRRYMTESLYT